jgi:ABC-type nitrate/sulfonate/bicarbonate transport system substrate-binding protein
MGDRAAALTESENAVMRELGMKNCWFAKVVVAVAGFTLWLAALSTVAPALAADKIHLGKSAAPVWAFSAADIGVGQGIYAKYGLDVDISVLGSDAKLEEALTAGSMDFGFGSGPAMAFGAKGAPVIGVAALIAQPRSVALLVNPDSPVRTASDLKGKTIGIIGLGGLTEWLTKEMAAKEGWGSTEIHIVEVGPFSEGLAALKTHQVDAIFGSIEAGYALEEQKEGHVLLTFDQFVPKFVSNVVLARKELAANDPDVVTRFLKGTFAAIRFMKANREKAVEIVAKILHQSPSSLTRAVDWQDSAIEDDGHFDPEAIEILKQSFVDMGTLDAKPTNNQLFTTRFVPVEP